MPQQPSSSVMSSFIGGLKTEFTGLNFPENACTDCSNTIFNIVGDATSRQGINIEENGVNTSYAWFEGAISTYRWKNAGGDGLTEVLVQQVSNILYFYLCSSSTTTQPLSQTLLPTTVNINTYATNTAVQGQVECQFADGNGYLFVFHPGCDPFYCTYANEGISSFDINILIRDFSGIPEPGVSVTTRPLTLTSEHEYNLLNQGWVLGAPWSATSLSPAQGITLGPKSFNVAAGLSAIPGQLVQIQYTGIIMMTGVVTGYSGTTMTITVTYVNPTYVNQVFTGFSIIPTNAGLISTWTSVANNYPSNSDVWWNYKDDTGVFNPSLTLANVSLNTAPAPRGHFILPAFNQSRSGVSGIGALTNVSTVVRPKTGAWHQGRIFYAGVDAAQAATGDEPFYTWTENIYFSQTIIDTTQIPLCYQTNDPTNEDLFDLLPTDGGVIQIQGCGSIYKLFSIQNGLLVFASNGIWFITGNTGSGFTATDYTVNRISSVQSISGTSFINVLGYPIFWNEEGIYSVTTGQQNIPYGHGGLVVENLCLGTILTFYNNIPKLSKQYVRGDYNPVTFIVSWTYRSTPEIDVTSRYQRDSILNLNIYNKAFYPYTIGGEGNTLGPYLCDIRYMSYPAASTAPDPGFKYLTTYEMVSGNYNFTFCEENDNVNWVDFYYYNNTGFAYNSYFKAGYNLKGKAFARWQPLYVFMYLRNETPSQYLISGIWDYAGATDSNRYSPPQLITNFNPNYGMLIRRHKIPGHGLAFQLYVQSVPGQPFDIMGWAMYEAINQGVG